MLPLGDSTLENLNAELEWCSGSPGTVSFDVYFGTNAAAVEKAANTLTVGSPADFTNVYKGNQPVNRTSFGPVRLALAQTYYWRVDQRDASGKVTPGKVSRFFTEHGNATEPAPADGYIFVEGGKQVLNWKPGKYAVKQNIYFGETPEKAAAARIPALRDLDPGVDLHRAADEESSPRPENILARGVDKLGGVADHQGRRLEFPACQKESENLPACGPVQRGRLQHGHWHAGPI